MPRPTAQESSSPAVAQIVLVDESAVSRRRLALLIRKNPGMTICGEAADLPEAEAVIAACRPDLIVLTLVLGEAATLEWTAGLRAQGITAPVLLLIPEEQPAFAERALRAGAQGCISLTETPSAISTAMRDVLAGEVSVSAATASSLLRRMTTPTADPRVSRIALLSDRELEIFRLLAAGHKTRDIAKAVRLSESTVNSHCFRIRRKLGVKNAAELHYYAANWAGK